MLTSKYRKLGALLAATITTALVVVACGGGEAAPTAKPIYKVADATAVPTLAPKIVVEKGAAPTARPTAKPIVKVETPTPLPPLGIASPTEDLKGFRWLQGPGLDSWRQPPKRGGTHVYAFPYPGGGTDQTIKRSFTVSTAISAVYSKLFTCQAAPLMVNADPGNCYPVGDLVTEVSSSDDASTWTMKLHPSAKWHNFPTDGRGYDASLKSLYGRDVVAADVVHTVNYWMGNLTKPNGDPQGTPSSLPMAQTIASVEAIDDKTVKIVLKDPNPYFLSAFSDFNYRVYPPEIFNLDGDYTQKTVGSGGFMLTEWDRLVQWGGDANADFFKTGADGSPLPYMDRHEVKVIGGDLTRSGLITGQIDSALSAGISGPSSALNFGRSCPDCQVLEYFLSSNSSRILGFKHLPNEQFPDPYFADRNARLAIAKAIDYQSIGDNLFEGAWIMTPVGTPWGLVWDKPPTLEQMGLDLPDDDNPFVFNPERAKELWALAGKSPGEKLQLMYTQYNPTHTTYTVALGGSISDALDIEVDVFKVPDIAILYTATGFVNPDDIQNHEHMVTHTRNSGANNATVPLAFRSDNGENYFGFRNEKIDAIGAEWSLAPDVEREKELAKAFYAELVNDLLFMPALTEASYDAQSGRVRGSYQQLRGGRAFHQGGQLTEIMWLDD